MSEEEKKVLFGLRIEDSHALKYKLLGGGQNGFIICFCTCKA